MSHLFEYKYVKEDLDNWVERLERRFDRARSVYQLGLHPITSYRLRYDDNIGWYADIEALAREYIPEMFYSKTLNRYVPIYVRLH
jgi:hypothetical protein